MTEQAIKNQNPGNRDNFWKQFPWWFLATIGLLGIFLYFILTETNYRDAFQFISQGLSKTLIITFASIVPAVLIGLLIGYASTRKNALVRNLAFFYLATIGGIPTIVMILISAWIIVPFFADLVGVETRSINNSVRGIIALTLVYGAIYGDVFRLGFARRVHDPAKESANEMRSKTLVAAGITFIALLKDTSLVSVMGVQEIVQMAKLWSGLIWTFSESFNVAIFLYLILTIPLRFLQHQFEQRWDLNRG